MLTLSLFLSSCGSHKTEVIAHRGASGMEVENTLEAVQKAIDLKSDAVEVDIWKTIDDSLVVFHDRNTARLSEDSAVVPESSFNDLRKVRLKEDRQIPSLREVLELLPANMRLFIEIKCCWEPGDAGNVFPMLSQMLKETGKEGQVAVISFNPQKLKDAFRYLPDVPRYLLLGQEMTADEIVNAALNCYADGIDIQYALLSEVLMLEAKKNNLEVYVWTVNSHEDAKKMVNVFGAIDGITTDFPGLLIKELDNSGN